MLIERPSGCMIMYTISATVFSTSVEKMLSKYLDYLLF